MSSTPGSAAGPAAGSGPLPASGSPAQPAAPTGVTAPGDRGLQRLARAIDELARAAHATPCTDVTVTELAERLAAIWAMAAGLDPEVAARLSGYSE